MDESLAKTSSRDALLVLMPTLRYTVAVSSTMKFIRFNEKTITSKQAFMEELDMYNELGYSIDHAEEMEGQHSIGSAVVNSQGYPVGAIWITGPSSRLTEKDFKQIGNNVRAHAEEISHALGYVAFKVA